LRYLVLRQCRLVTMYELTGTSHNCTTFNVLRC